MQLVEIAWETRTTATEVLGVACNRRLRNRVDLESLDAPFVHRISHRSLGQVISIK